MPGFSLYQQVRKLIGKVLSMELGDRGITVNTVSPGPTETEMGAQSGDDTEAASAIAFNRLGKPEDIADVIAFVVSENVAGLQDTFQAGGGYV